MDDERGLGSSSLDHMLLFKRLVTSFILAFLLTFTLLVAVGSFIGEHGAIPRPTAREQAHRQETGHGYPYELTRHYGAVVILSTLGVSALAALVISFSGILPLCRKEPPSTPISKV
jgi:hypothetical protein